MPQSALGTYPQPWLTDDGVRIAGYDRADDPALTAEQPARELIMEITYNFSRAFGFNGAPIAEAARERTWNPRVGDLIVITDALRRPAEHDDRVKAFGYLVAQRTEWMHTDQEWQEGLGTEGWWDPDEQRPREYRVSYVQYGPAAVDVCRWVNAGLGISVPIERRYGIEGWN